MHRDIFNSQKEISTIPIEEYTHRKHESKSGGQDHKLIQIHTTSIATTSASSPTSAAASTPSSTA